MTNNQQLQSLYKLFSMGYEKAESEFGKGFPAYFPDMFRCEAHVKKYVSQAAYFFSQVGAQNKRVADCGCGYGTKALLFRIFGASEVWGIEREKNMVETLGQCMEFIQPPLSRVHAILTNAECLPFGTGSMDVVTAFDSISHIGNVSRFFKEVKRVLRSGGKFLIHDGNSTLDLIGRIRRKRIWSRREYGPWDHKRYYLKDSESPEPFSQQRRVIIERLAPDMSPGDVNELVELTQGMWMPEISQAVEAFQCTGEVAYKPEFHCKDPVSGEAAERAFNPFNLISELSSLGFNARLCRPFYITRHPIKKVIATLFSWTYPLSIPLVHSFTLLAERKPHKQKG